MKKNPCAFTKSIKEKDPSKTKDSQEIIFRSQSSKSRKKHARSVERIKQNCSPKTELANKSVSIRKYTQISGYSTPKRINSPGK